MRKLFVCTLGMMLLAACHSESDFSGEGTAKVSLDLVADPSFTKTKAIDVSAYQDVNNYTVELSKDGTVLESVKYGDMELTKELEPEVMLSGHITEKMCLPDMISFMSKVHRPLI